MTVEEAGRIARRYCRLVDHMQGACDCPELTADILAAVAAERERCEQIVRAVLSEEPVSGCEAEIIRCIREGGAA